MTTTTQTHGGGAQPASIDTSGKATGGAAMRVYGFDSEADAIAAGYVCEGGPAMSVALITDAQLASGAWRLEGDPSGTAVYTAPANMPVEGGYAVPVYPVNGWGSAPAPVGPQFSAAEVGTVNASTVAVTFDQDVSASDYSAGVTIKVNGSAATISSATRQTNHAIVYYVLSAAVVFGDTVTWEYVEVSGNIVAEDDSTPLANVTAQSVTNNVPAAPVALLDLESDQLVLNDGDPVSSWTDGVNNFTTGGAPPDKQTVSGYPAVVFVVGDSLIGSSSLADNLDAFTVFVVKALSESGSVQQPLFSKMNSYSSGAGWMILKAGFSIVTQEDGGSVYYQQDYDPFGTGFSKRVFCYMFNSKNNFSFYLDGVLQTPSNIIDGGPVVNMTTVDPVRINADGTADDGFSGQTTYAVRIYSGALSDSIRASIESELAARYGITL